MHGNTITIRVGTRWSCAPLSHIVPLPLRHRRLMCRLMSHPRLVTWGLMSLSLVMPQKTQRTLITNLGGSCECSMILWLRMILLITSGMIFECIYKHTCINIRGGGQPRSLPYG